MEYKTLETGNSSKHNNQNNYQWNIKHQKTGNRSKHNKQSKQLPMEYKTLETGNS